MLHEPNQSLRTTRMLARHSDDIVAHYAPNPEALQQRIISSVKAPERDPPTEEQFFMGSMRPNVAFLRRHFHAEGRLTEEQAIWILEKARDIFGAEPNVLHLDAPITICGDIHGQYYDLMKLFEVGGSPAKGRYLFLGDYVDRGSFSIECVLYLFSLKIWYPDRIFLLRGNHECRYLTEYFTFKTECLRKYSENLYNVCMATFDRLPLAAIVNKQFFCAHGGISPEMTTIDDLQVIDRFQEVTKDGLMNDILWSDPAEPEATHPKDVDFIENKVRGCSYFYTYEAVCKFLKRNKLLSIIRAHEAQKEGYRMYKPTPEGFPSVITVFSCPNYLDTYQNKGAILMYDQKITVRQFTYSPHPYWLPSFMDAFTWTLPFVAEKVSNMFEGLLNTISTEEMEAEEEKEKELNAAEIYARRQQIKAKIRTVGRMSRVFALLREDTEKLSELKRLDDAEEGASPLLNSGLEQAKRSIHGFEDAQKSDRSNERIPQGIFHNRQKEPERGATGNGYPAPPRSHGPSPSPSARQRSTEATLRLIRQIRDEENM